jgi:hypothetical protein
LDVLQVKLKCIFWHLRNLELFAAMIAISPFLPFVWEWRSRGQMRPHSQDMNLSGLSKNRYGFYFFLSIPIRVGFGNGHHFCNRIAIWIAIVSVLVPMQNKNFLSP